METIMEEVYVSKKTKKVYLTDGMKIDIENPVERNLADYTKFGENNVFEFWRKKRTKKS